MNAARQLSSPTAVAATAASSNDKLLDDVFSDVGVQLQALTSAAGGAAMATATTVGTAGGAGAEDFPLLVPTAGPGIMRLADRSLPAPPRVAALRGLRDWFTALSRASTTSAAGGGGGGGGGASGSGVGGGGGRLSTSTNSFGESSAWAVQYEVLLRRLQVEQRSEQGTPTGRWMAGVCYRLKTRKRRSSLVSLHCFAALLAESGSGRNNRNNNNSNANGADDDDNDDDDILVMDDAADRLNNAGLLPLNGGGGGAGGTGGALRSRSASSYAMLVDIFVSLLLKIGVWEYNVNVAWPAAFSRLTSCTVTHMATSIQAQLSLVSLNSSLLTRCSLLLAQQGYAFPPSAGSSH